ncbi:PRELI domain-containing protein 2-like isoform X2 [Physella acuta]|uniref:PRELI domain-containing protein 2-like isoform X2 n=1 Tax=Physella acuta TaxID=109671 RepID=UPI0027DD3438|nr:PRELI domain-containing protein 2-like isoform X2 [Physella acuta]
MVVSFNIEHIFKYPVQQVANTHLTKYPTDKEKVVLKVETLEHSVDWNQGIDYRRRWAFCQNVLPGLMKKVDVLNEKAIILEEESWMNLRSGDLLVKSRNITWAKYATMNEQTKFAPAADNANWTKFEQSGYIEVKNLGSLGALLEIFACKFLNKGALKALRVMEELLNEKSHSAES